MKKILFSLLVLAGITATAQVKVGDNPTTLAASSLLELESTNKVLVVTRLNSADISTPVDGMVIYENSMYCFRSYADGVWKNMTTCIPTITSPTGRIWMDRNLGASQVATSSTDAASYGDYYQWGRAADGHHLSTVVVGTTPTLATSATAGHANFVTNTTPGNWTSFAEQDNLWQGVVGINNPCPSGFRLGTEAEWAAEVALFPTANAAGAFASVLKLPVAGTRTASTGAFSIVGTFGYYWTSTISVIANRTRALAFGSSVLAWENQRRSHAYSIRCIKN